MSVLLVASFSLLAPEKASDRQAARNAPPPPPGRLDADVVPRLHYPYSVVQGGVHSTMELTSAVRDPVVAAHYASVNIASARVATVRAARRVHVSYRVGNRIYWTRRKVTLSTGERILTDGRTEIRTRCGNRISDTLQDPTSDDEPQLAEFDRAIVPPSPAEALESNGLPTATMLSSGIADSAPGDDVAFGGPLSGRLTPASMAIGGSPGDSGLVFPPDQPFGDPPSVPQPVPVPEPGSLLLVATGLTGGAWRAWRRRRLNRTRQP